MATQWEVLLPMEVDPSGPESIADFATCTGMDEYGSYDDALADIGRYDAVIVRVAQLDADVIERADRLEIIAKHGSGLDNVDVAAASRRDIVVCNTPGANAQSVAEHAIALLFGVRRQLHTADRHVRSGEWDRAAFTGRELSDDTLGLDFVWLDFEHAGPSPYDSTVFEELTRAAEAADVELLVRLPAPEPPLVRKALDAGVRTILLPRIETASELRPAVEAAYFSYDGDVGDRGVGVGRAGEWAGYVDSYVGGEDDEILVGTMIENRQAVDNIEEILAVPQLGFAFLGPADLSISLSAGDPTADKPDAIADAIDRVHEACLAADVPIGRIQNDAAAAQAAIDDGYRIVRIGGDVSAITDTLGSRLDELER